MTNNKAKYYAHIGSSTNVVSDPKFFCGTGFMGEPFSTREEFLELVRKYATREKDGIKYWREEIKFSFSLGESVEAFKASGDAQCKEKGFIDLLLALSCARKDPFNDISIIYRPSGWEDKAGNEFKFVVIKGEQIIPTNGKLTSIMRTLGIEI